MKIKRISKHLEIIIDSKNVSVDSIQGEIAPDLSALTGKNFDMTLSVLGKELELSGAEAIQFEMGEAGTRDVSYEFQALFPDLAEKPVKVGNTCDPDIQDQNQAA